MSWASKYVFTAYPPGESVTAAKLNGAITDVLLQHYACHEDVNTVIPSNQFIGTSTTAASWNGDDEPVELEFTKLHADTRLFCFWIVMLYSDATFFPTTKFGVRITQVLTPFTVTDYGLRLPYATEVALEWRTHAAGVDCGTLPAQDYVIRLMYLNTAASKRSYTDGDGYATLHVVEAMPDVDTVTAWPTDDFNRADGELGSTPGQGIPWAHEYIKHTIVTNRAQPAANGALTIISVPHANQRVDVDAVVPAANNVTNTGIMLRYLDVFNYIYVVLYDADDATYNRVVLIGAQVNGSFTTLAVSAAAAWELSTTVALRATIVGNVVKGYTAGVERVSYTLTSPDSIRFANERRVGLLTFTFANTFLDNFVSQQAT